MSCEQELSESKIFQKCVRNNFQYNILKSYFTKEDMIDNFSVHSSDIWMFGFPQSGSAKLREIIWLMENNFDTYRAKLFSIDERFPLFETELYTLQGEIWQRNSINYVNTMKAPRLIRCGLQWPFLPKEIRFGLVRPKMIYIHREPKDLVVSYYHGAKKINAYAGPFEPLAELFLSDESPYWRHVIDFRKRRNLLDLLLISYEEIEDDLEVVIRRVANYLEKPISNDAIELMRDFLQVRKTEKYLTYKCLMGSEMIQRFDEWSFPNLIDEPELTSFDNVQFL